MSLSTLELTIPGDVLNGGAPNDITAAVVAEAFALALYGTGPGNTPAAHVAGALAVLAGGGVRPVLALTFDPTP